MPWTFQVENFNTGRVLAAYNYGEGFAFSSYGRVCSGSGSRSIRGKNGKKFGQLVCSMLGFGAVLFVGVEKEYRGFMAKRSRKNMPWSSRCLPPYRISGATCLTDKKCNVFDYARDGGTCVEGESDVFVHCQKRSSTSFGEWSEWISADEGVCKRSDYFRQEYRVCRRRAPPDGGKPGNDDDAPFCAGPWIRNAPCGVCQTNALKIEDYNDVYVYKEDYQTDKEYSPDYSEYQTYKDYSASISEYDLASSSDLEYGSSSSSSWQYDSSEYTISDYSIYARRKRSVDRTICNCTLDSNNQLSDDEDDLLNEVNVIVPPLISPLDAFGVPICNSEHRTWTDTRGKSCAFYKYSHLCSLLSARELSRPWRKNDFQRNFMRYQNGGWTALNCPQCGCK